MSTQVRVTGIRRQEPDYQRLARALLALVEELSQAEEQPQPAAITDPADAESEDRATLRPQARKAGSS